MFPAFFIARFQPAKVLTGKFSPYIKNINLRSILILIQFVIAVFLSTSTIVIYNQLNYIKNRELGFTKGNVITVHIPYDAKNLRDNIDIIKHELRLNPNISSVSFISNLPIIDQAQTDFWKENSEGYTKMRMNFISVDYDFIKTLNIDIVKGRNYSQSFSNDKRAFIINEAAAEKLGWKNPVGKQISMRGKNDTGEIIGVIKNFHFRPLYQKIEPIILRPGTDVNWILVKINSKSNTETTNYIRNTIQKYSLFHKIEYSFLSNDIEQVYISEVKFMQFFRLFCFLTIFLTCLGLLGLASFTTEQRVKEIGIRKILGASFPELIFRLTSNFIKIVVISNFIAAPIAFYFLTKWLQNFAYRVDIKIGEFLLVLIFTLFLTLFTVSFQVIKASLRNPVVALKSE